jgi:hypothetical protein
MKNTLLLPCLLFILAPARADSPKEQATKSPLAGTGLGSLRFETPFVPDGGRLESIEVNLGRKFGGTVVKGFRFVGKTADGNRVETVIGPAAGKYDKPIELKEGVEVIGVSGKHGVVIDSISFHFSDGTASPIAGGSGGSEEFKLILREKDGRHRGRVRGLFGLADQDTVTGVGLMLLGPDGVAAELDHPDTLELTIHGDVDAEFAPTVGGLTALYYECYPALLKRLDNPMKPARRHVALVFKRGMPVPAYSSGGEISISIDWLKQNPDDIALLTHELTHIVQDYPGGEPGWLVEGIADYTRHVYGPKHQPGWKLPEAFTPKQSYTDGYRTTAKFLLWLEGQHPGLIDKLHRRLQTRQFEVGDFKRLTGKTVDALWMECSAALRKK